MNKKRESSLASCWSDRHQTPVFLHHQIKTKPSLVNWINDDSHWPSSQHQQKACFNIQCYHIAINENQINKKKFIYEYIVQKFQLFMAWWSKVIPRPSLIPNSVRSPFCRRAETMSCFVLLRPTSAGIKTARMPSASNFNGALTSGRMTPDRICSDWLRLAFASLQVQLRHFLFHFLFFFLVYFLFLYIFYFHPFSF